MSRLTSTLPAGVKSSTLDASTRLRGGWLVAAWVLWVILALLCLVNFVASIPNYLQAAQASCQPGACVAGQPTMATALVLRQFGLSVSAYATLSVALVGVTAMVYCGAATIIIWRKPSDWMALLVSSMFVTQGLYENNFLQGPFDNQTSPWHVVGLAIAYISPVQVLAVCALFPNGKFVARWIGWTLLALCLIDIAPSFFPTMPYGDLIESVFVLSGFPLVAGSMIYRFRRASTPTEQQQTKWVVFGLLVVFVAFMAWFIPQIILFGTLSQPGSLYDLIGHPLFTFASLAIPICVTIAILRYRLWDIDVIINKALVYGSLTVLLTALYAGLIIGLETLAQIIARQKGNEPVALVISTLAIAALFQPARKRIQLVIDRRFYRRKYNADKTLANFGAMVRNEVDLKRLCEQLIAVVDETMQSTHISLWLRQPQHSTEQMNSPEQQTGNR